MSLSRGRPLTSAGRTLTFRTVVVRQSPVAVERDPDGAALGRLEFLAVQLARVRVRQDDVVPGTAKAASRAPRQQCGRRYESKRGGHEHARWAGKVAQRTSMAPSKNRPPESAYDHLTGQAQTRRDHVRGWKYTRARSWSACACVTCDQSARQETRVERAHTSTLRGLRNARNRPVGRSDAGKQSAGAHDAAEQETHSRIVDVVFDDLLA